MKVNVGIGILLFCCGAIFAFLLMQDSHNPGAVSDSVHKSTDKSAQAQTTLRHDKRIDSSDTMESSWNGHDSSARRITKVKSNSSTNPQGNVSHSHSFSQSELLITRDRHTASTAYVPVTRDRIIEKTIKSDHVIDRLTVVGLREENGGEQDAPAMNADPVNPQQGMLFSAYNCSSRMEKEQLKESNSSLPQMPALKTGVDKGDGFSVKCATDVKAVAIRWEGFLKCKRAATYTFIVDRGDGTGYENGYSVRINGDLTVTGYGCNAFDADLKVGWNKVEIVCQFEGNESFNISAKIKGSVAKPTKFSPGMLFYDDRPELEEMGF